jgi:hypothetical protein
MKSPHTQRPDADARMLTEDFIATNSRTAEGAKAAEAAAEAVATDA